MTLATDVQARYADQVLVNLTNPGESAPTTVDATRLGLAADDVQADFEIVAGVVYDGTDGRHVSVAVQGVMAKLFRRTSHSSADDRETEYFRRLNNLAKVTGRDRLLPSTISLLDPSLDSDDGSTRKPAFDDKVFREVNPGAPRSS